MKTIFYRLIALICVMFMMLSAVTVFADTPTKEPQKLYEKYGYNKDFQYDDTAIGFVLKASVPQIRMVMKATIEYSPVVFNKTVFLDTFRKLYGEYGDKIKVAEIIEVMVNELKNNTVRYLSYEGSKRVEIEGEASGSGIVIGEDGYIATNSHVVTPTEETKKEVYFSEVQKGVIEDLEAIVTEISGYGIEFSEEELYSLYEVILTASSDEIDIINESFALEVCFPTAEGSTKKSDAQIYKAEVVAEGTQEGTKGLTEDAAILKIDAGNLVALNLSDTYPESNSSIVTAGYPGVAEAVFQTAGSDASALSVTICPGTVTRSNPVDGSEYQAISIQSTVSNGSSGGPSVDTNLNIEGLNTYMFKDDNRFSYMVSAEFLRALAEGLEIKQGDVTKTFLTGIQLLQKNYGPAALECFESVAQSQPNLPYIQDMIKKAEAAPKNEFNGLGLSAEEDGEDSFLSLKTVIWIAVGILLLMTIGALILSKKNKIAIARKASETVPLYTEVIKPSSVSTEQKSYDISATTIPLVDYNPPVQSSSMEVRSDSIVETPTVNDAITQYQYEQNINQSVQLDAGVLPDGSYNAVSGDVHSVPSMGSGLRSTMPRPRSENYGDKGKNNNIPKHEAFTRASDLD